MQDHGVSDTSFVNSTEGLSEHRSSRSELTPLYSTSPDNDTLRVIIIFFSVVSIAVTFALALQIYYGNPQVIRYGTVSSLSEMCSTEGLSIIKKGGNAVDASITTAFCLSVVYPHITGIGGGGLMLIYNHKEKKVVDCIDFRVSRSTDKIIGVPGFIAGLSLAHRLYGSLPWKTLLEPAINLAKYGFPVSATLMETRTIVSPTNYNEQLRNWLTSLEGKQIITMPGLASLLSVISNSTETSYDDILGLSNYLNKTDIDNYVALSKPVVREIYNGYEVIASGDGSGGPLLLENILNMTNNGIGNGSTPSIYSSTVITLDLDDLYVSLVSGLGSLFGSQILMKSGYILNDFLNLTNDTHYIPMVPLTPVIMVQKERICGIRYISGGSNIPELSYVIYKLLHNDTKVQDDNTHGLNSENLSSPAPSFKMINKQYIFTPFQTIINVVKKIADEVTVYPNILKTFK